MEVYKNNITLKVVWNRELNVVRKSPSVWVISMLRPLATLRSYTSRSRACRCPSRPSRNTSHHVRSGAASHPRSSSSHHSGAHTHTHVHTLGHTSLTHGHSTRPHTCHAHTAIHTSSESWTTRSHTSHHLHPVHHGVHATHLLEHTCVQSSESLGIERCISTSGRGSCACGSRSVEVALIAVGITIVVSVVVEPCSVSGSRISTFLEASLTL